MKAHENLVNSTTCTVQIDSQIFPFSRNHEMESDCIILVMFLHRPELKSIAFSEA